ncbi:BrnA antitoxin family protein [Aurantimonas sp. HBX-1]|uniref:BrnA antitoxin family protein n=1 Tax=Aurantimonas sp. HBX-1 TaxID=2906072 RepID=UPI001F2AE0C6|nr:BrnA antitoxin family protein [Aurantimonas sp. HBX-1]UIJ71984.1 BrnA antitoxin family protein [Aurantimonas sp. HBX-1]
MARRPLDPREAAEAMFRPASPAATGRVRETPGAIPAGREMVSLRIDRDVLAHFQEDGPGWQDRINAALRQAAGL